MTVSKDQSIIMQVCAKIASELTPKSEDVNANITMFADAYEAVCEIILTSQGLSASSPQPVVQQSHNPAPAPSNDEATFMHAFPSATPSTTPSGFSVTIKGKQHGPIPEWLNEQCAMKGVTEVWDNRDGLGANPKRPWFKSTSTNDAFWEPKRK
jgi:hypothetical protein